MDNHIFCMPCAPGWKTSVLQQPVKFINNPKIYYYNLILKKSTTELYLIVYLNILLYLWSIGYGWSGWLHTIWIIVVNPICLLLCHAHCGAAAEDVTAVQLHSSQQYCSAWRHAKLVSIINKWKNRINKSLHMVIKNISIILPTDCFVA